MTMKSSCRFLGAVASLALWGAVANVDVFAQDAPAAANAVGAQATFDEALLDVKDGEKSDYYKQRLSAIGAAIQRFATDEKNRAKVVALSEKLRAAHQTIFKNLSEADDLAPQERDMFFANYAYASFGDGDVDAAREKIETLKKENADNPNRLAALTYILFVVRLGQTEQASDAELAKLVAEIKDATLADAAFAPLGAQLLSQISQMKPKIAEPALEEVVAKFAASDNDELKSFAQRLGGGLRFAKLIGNEMKVEGLYLDGTEIDWNAYRGKVVLVDFWATWCGPCVGEIPNVRKLYEKYNAAGFEVLGYSLDQDLDDLKKFEEEQKLPWKTASQKKSLESAKKYVDLAAYYGIKSIPTMILVGKDGKVLDTNARGERLQALLEKEFSEAK